MDVNTKIDFNSICRICLKADASLSNLYDTEAPDMLRFCGFLEVNETDEYPNKICIVCFSTLKDSCRLKQLCIISNTSLQSYVVDAVGALNDLECPQMQGARENEADSIILKTAPCIFDWSGCRENSVISKDDQNDCDALEVDKDRKVSISSHKCPHCKIIFGHPHDLSIHQSVHAMGHNKGCNVCEKVFKDVKTLKRHLKTHMISKTHQCKLCNKSFSESSDVSKHTKRHHLGVPREKNYQCKDCGQRFTDRYYLNVHQRKHSGEKPLKCEICDKCFYDPRSLRVHTNGHRGIKPYLCNYCGKAFLQNAHLRQHLVVHSQEKPYSCDVCQKQFTQSTSLQRHQKLHLENYKCPVCLKGFSKKHQLFKHENEEHG